ncbi:hypothetical protein QR680_000507 [Steinernema hermaphroditum]|uniref:Uncharacterized protein n=1 Tax=Steinernema hermaphroditum TaxID=289476 RepID=A0AA39GWT4_9BILA|nr:hypothetical protein QR680_000507 [Steinernema hermaphroditum]
MVIFKECLKYHTKLYCERREHLIVFGSLFLLLAIFATIVVLNIVITELKNISAARWSALPFSIVYRVVQVMNKLILLAILSTGAVAAPLLNNDPWPQKITVRLDVMIGSDFVTKLGSEKTVQACDMDSPLGLHPSANAPIRSTSPPDTPKTKNEEDKDQIVLQFVFVICLLAMAGVFSSLMTYIVVSSYRDEETHEPNRKIVNDPKTKRCVVSSNVNGHDLSLLVV